jgi:hypothetical protein
MTISEFKLENHKPITEEVAESQVLFDGTYAEEGTILIDCLLITEENPEGSLIYVTPTQLAENLTIVENAEYDVFLPLAEQKFKVTLKQF